MQRRACVGLQQQLCAVTTGPTLHWRRYWPEQLDAMQVVLGQQLLGGGAGFIEKAIGLPRLVGFGAQ